MNAIERWEAGGTALIDVRLAAIRYAARDIHLLELEAVSGGRLPPAEPGAHIELHLPKGLVRHYSLLEPDPQPARYVIGIKRDAGGRGGSVYIHDHLKVGMTLQVSAPRNNFRLVEDAPHAVLIAGGIGITPLVSMARRLESAGRPWNLFYACRSRADAAFHAELGQRENVAFHFDDERPGEYPDIAAVIGRAPEGAHFYCCGPAPMLAAFERTAATMLPPSHIHIEYFNPVQEAATEGGFVVELARRKREFLIPPGSSILQTLLDAGLNVPYSCTEGMCGACEVRVLSGTPDHRDSVLTKDQQAEGKRMMICCSGSKSGKLVIDL